MASPVDTSVKVFYSTMFAAPQGFRGVIGSALPVIVACLVNGFDEVTLSSLTVTDGIATATFPAGHSAVAHCVVLIAGAGGAGLDVLNGEQKVVTRIGNTITFTTDAPDGTATGTITMKMAPAGWTQEFTGTNLVSLRPNATDGNRHFLRLQDTSTTTLRAVGYENMTEISTGTGQFPTTAQMSGGCYWPKSESTAAIDNPWMIVADGKRMYLGVATGLSTEPNYASMNVVGFGDFRPYRKTADPYATFISIGGASALSWDANLGMQAIGSGWGYAPRPHTAVGASSPMELMSSVGATGISGIDSRFGTYPGIADGLYLAKSLIGTNMTTQGPRGELSGIWHVPQIVAHGTFAMGDTIPGAGDTAGRVLMAMPVSSSYGTLTWGHAFFDVTGPW